MAELDTDPCTHPVQYNGLCAQCGMDLTEQGSVPVTVNLSHDSSALTVTLSEATRLEQLTTTRLIESRKLSLIVDLDQTIIHATVDPTIREWQADPTNPNHKVVEDVKSFELRELGGSCWYYIKVRPGLQDFLRNLSKKYEMHVYTMGTRAYAWHVGQIIDPNGDFFGARILSRDESGNLTQKNIKRLFPCETNMVVVIDDRADVWNWSANLLRVAPYEFFVGIGDINSSFLAQRDPLPENLLPPTTTAIDTAPTNTVATTPISVSEVDQLVAMSGGSDPDLVSAQTTQQHEALEAQQNERPLAKQQEQLNEHERLSLLRDDDTELHYVEIALNTIHDEFFKSLEKSKTSHGQHKPSHTKVPDVKIILPRLKTQVLEGIVILFSGVVPLNVDVQSADIALWAKSFGATIATTLSSQVTHVVASRPNTAKTRSAARYPSIAIVTLAWLQNSISRWTCLPEKSYLIDQPPLPASALKLSPSPEPNSLSVPSAAISSPSVSSTEGDGDEEIGTTQSIRPSPTQKRLIEGDDSQVPTPSPLDSSKLATVDWSQADKELEEFLAETDGSDADSIASNDSFSHKSKKRRPRSRMSTRSNSDDDEESPNQTVPKSRPNPLAKRRRMAQQRSSLLSISFVPDTKPPAPSEDHNLGDEESDLEDFAAELEAGMN